MHIYTHIVIKSEQSLKHQKGNQERVEMGDEEGWGFEKVFYERRRKEESWGIVIRMFLR